jgi:hypothetical protein
VTVFWPLFVINQIMAKPFGLASSMDCMLGLDIMVVIVCSKQYSLRALLLWKNLSFWSEWSTCSLLGCMQPFGCVIF